MPFCPSFVESSGSQNFLVGKSCQERRRRLVRERQAKKEIPEGSLLPLNQSSENDKLFGKRCSGEGKG